MPREHSATTRREEANPSTLIRPLPLTPSSSDGKKTSSSSSSSSSSSLSLRRIGQTILNSPFYAGASPTNKPAADQDRQSSLLAMIEERRKSGLKLRGLVIPDLNTSNTSSTNNNNNKPLSAFTSAVSSHRSSSNNNRESSQATVVTAVVDKTALEASAHASLPSPATAGLPKYSPAFKRKSLSVFQYSSPPVAPSPSAAPPSSPPSSSSSPWAPRAPAPTAASRSSIITSSSSSGTTFSTTNNNYNNNNNNNTSSSNNSNNIWHKPGACDMRIATPSSTSSVGCSEESDGDSAVSSIGSDGSGVSHSPEPAITSTSTISTGSTPTSTRGGVGGGGGGGNNSTNTTSNKTADDNNNTNKHHIHQTTCPQLSDPSAKPSRTYPRARRQFSLSTEYPSKKWTFSPDSRTSDNIFLATKSFWDSKTELSGAASPPTTTTLQHHQQQHQLRTSVVVGPTPTLPHHQKEIKKFASEKNLLKVERDTMASVTNASAAASTTAINAADVNKTDGDKWNELQRKYSSSSDVTVIGESFGKQRPKDLLMSRLKSASLSPQKDSDHHRCFSSSISSNSSINITTGATEAGTTTSTTTTTTKNNNNNNRAPVKALAQKWEQMSQGSLPSPTKASPVSPDFKAPPPLPPAPPPPPPPLSMLSSSSHHHHQHHHHHHHHQLSMSRQGSVENNNNNNKASVDGFLMQLGPETPQGFGEPMFDYFSSSMAPSEASELCEQQDVLDGEVEAEAESLGSRSSSSQELLLMGAGGSSLLGQPLLSAALDNNRGSSVDSSTSEEGSIQAYTPGFSSYVGLTGSGMRDFGGSVTSLASTTSLISPQELQQLMEDADAGDGSGTPSHEILVVVLHREYPTAGSVGITLAGGADYDTKDITIHRVISGSVADRDGRVQRGDRILSINGRGLKGLTHSEAMNILKAPRQEVVLVLSRSRSATPASRGESPLQSINCRSPPTAASSGSANSSSSSLQLAGRLATRPPRILESPMDSKSLISDISAWEVNRGPPITITLKKGGPGLGFSLEGGKDSPYGDRPLTVKKIFVGGVADKEGTLRVGDELLSVNAVPLATMSRLEAWNCLKRLPDGDTTLVIRQKIEKTAPSAPSASQQITMELCSSVKSP